MWSWATGLREQPEWEALCQHRAGNGWVRQGPSPESVYVSLLRRLDAWTDMWPAQKECRQRWGKHCGQVQRGALASWLKRAVIQLALSQAMENPRWNKVTQWCLWMNSHFNCKPIFLIYKVVPLFLTAPCGVSDLRSLTRDGTCAPCSERQCLNQPGDDIFTTNIAVLLWDFQNVPRWNTRNVVTSYCG